MKPKTKKVAPVSKSKDAQPKITNNSNTKAKATPKKTGAKPDKLTTQTESEIAAKVEEDKKATPVAKAGKRSTKAVAETAAQAAKEQRKAVGGHEKPKTKATKPPRSRLERAGKKYREVAKLVDRQKTYSLAEAMELVVKTSTTKFDSSVEMHLNLGVDPKQADQNVRDSVTLPAGTGKELKIAALAEDSDAQKAKNAGAALASADEIFAMLEKEETAFDVLIATPTMMSKLAKYARLLGPRGLMPNPKSGTVSADIAKAVSEAKAGKVEYRVDPQGIIHLSVGKVSFGPQPLTQNAEAILSSVKSARPANLKGDYLKSAYISTSMGPSVRVEV